MAPRTAVLVSADARRQQPCLKDGDRLGQAGWEVRGRGGGVLHLVWPKARKVHHTRGALKTPALSYTTTWVSRVIPSASAAAAKAATVGSMWGNFDEVSAIASTSKKRAPAQPARARSSGTN